MAERPGEDDVSKMEVQLLMPSAEEQRAIICSLESEDSEESLYVYSVSQAWYERWRAYVGLEQTVRQRSDGDGKHRTDQGRGPQEATSVADSLSPKTTTAADDRARTAASKRTSPNSEVCRQDCTEPDTRSSCAPTPPGPVEMDLTDEDNVTVDEKVKRS